MAGESSIFCKILCLGNPALRRGRVFEALLSRGEFGPINETLRKKAVSEYLGGYVARFGSVPSSGDFASLSVARHPRKTPKEVNPPRTGWLGISPTRTGSADLHTVLSLGAHSLHQENLPISCQNPRSIFVQPLREAPFALASSIQSQASPATGQPVFSEKGFLSNRLVFGATQPER
jgi:hypothetical protein